MLREAGAYMGETIVHGPWVWNGSVVSGVIAGKQSMPRALRPILHALQEIFGYIAREVEGLVVEALTISRAQMHVVTRHAADKPVHEAGNVRKVFARRPNVRVPEAVAAHIRNSGNPGCETSSVSIRSKAVRGATPWPAGQSS